MEYLSAGDIERGFFRTTPLGGGCLFAVPGRGGRKSLKHAPRRGSLLQRGEHKEKGGRGKASGTQVGPREEGRSNSHAIRHSEKKILGSLPKQNPEKGGEKAPLYGHKRKETRNA